MDDFENKGFFGGEEKPEPPKTEGNGYAGSFFTSATSAGELNNSAPVTPPESTAPAGEKAEPVAENAEPEAQASAPQEQPEPQPQGQQSTGDYRSYQAQGGQTQGQAYGYGQQNQGGYYGQTRNANPYSSAGYGYQSQSGQQGGYYRAPGGYQTYQPNPQPIQTPSAQKAKSNTGIKVFFAAVAIIAVVAVVGCAVLVKKYVNKPNSGFISGARAVTEEAKDENGEETVTDNVNIAVSPANTNSKALSVDKIAEKARESCVGVLVYANSNSSTEAGQGTGILAKEDAKNKCTYVLTCAHVIDDAGVKVKIQLEDGTSYDAQIVAYDTRTDVGVVKVNATGLKVAEFGDDTQLKVGSAVYAVGNPGGVEFFGSFTDGIVSAIDRPIDSEIGYTMKCIQHTAAINPGNSGGALVNVYGQVIGINSQKIASTEYEGMGFAIPITQALEIAENLINFKYVPNRAKLGITYYSLSASQQYSMIARFNQLPSGTLIINEIGKDSSLAGTKAQQYDMIIAVDGEELTTADVLLEKIDGGKVGDKMTLTLCRVNSNYSLEKFDVEITLVEDKGTTKEKTTATTAFYPFGDFDYGFGQ